MKYKKGDKVRIVSWNGEIRTRKLLIGKIITINRISEGHDYPYRFNEHGIDSGVCDNEIVLDKEFNIMNILAEIDSKEGKIDRHEAES